MTYVVDGMSHWTVLCLYVIATGAAYVGTALLSPLGQDAQALQLDALSLLEVAVLVGGRRRAAEVVVAWMFDAGMATVNLTHRNVYVDGAQSGGLRAAWPDVEIGVAGYVTRIDLLNEISRGLEPAPRALVARGLLRSRRNAILGTLACCLPLATTSTLGFCLVSFLVGPLRIGMAPADAGIAAVFVVSGIGFLFAGTDNGMTPVGIATRRAIRAAAREGRVPPTLPGRVAFLGPDQMRKTPFAAYVAFPAEDVAS